MIFSACRKQDKYVIHGNLRCVRAKKAYLMEMDPLGTPFVVDSAPIRAGEFRFRGHVDYPTMRFIRIGTRPPFEVFVENSEITVTGSMSLLEEISVEGSFSQDDFSALSKEYKQIVGKQSALSVRISEARRKRNMKEQNRLYKIYNTYPDSLVWMTKQFVLNNPSSMGAVYFLCVVAQSFDINKLEEVIGLFDASVQDAPYMQYLRSELALHKKFSVGMDAPDFCLPTFLGDTVRLENYSGKYLFLDFGASWCPRTSERVKALNELHEEFEDYGFEILSVFLDEEKKTWKNYVTDLGVLPWKLACDFQYWSSPITKYYRVQSIPYGVLVSPEGKVALKNPAMKELERYLEKKAKKRSGN